LAVANFEGLFCLAGLGLVLESAASADFFDDCEGDFSADFSTFVLVPRSDAGDLLPPLASGIEVRRSLSERPSVLKEKGLMGVTLRLASRFEPAFAVGDAELLPTGVLPPGFPTFAVLGGMI
jgi:hypothetical protein